MSDAPESPADGNGGDVSALAGSLVKISRRLADALPNITDEAARDELATSLASVREVSKSLRTIALLYDPEHARLFALHGGGLRRLVEAMGGLAADLTEANQHAAARLDQHVEALERITELPEGDIADRLQATVAEARAMAAEMFERFQGISGKVARAVESAGAMERELREAREKALLDAVTRLHSRVAFDERLRQAVAEGDRGGPWCLLLIEMDAMERLVETHGGVLGDALLYQLARLVEGAVPLGEGRAFLARYAGQEFALILLGVGLAEARELAERVREAAAAGRWQQRERPEFGVVRVTVSVGAAQFKPGDTVASLVGRANEALRQAHGAGGNAVATA